MANATTGRNTRRRDAVRVEHPVAAATTIYAGTMVALLTANGDAVPAGAANSGPAVGVAERDASAGERVATSAGCYQFGNSAAADEITRADIGAIAYVADNQTVAKLATGDRAIAGAIVDVDDDGVWVLIGPGAVGPQGAPG